MFFSRFFSRKRKREKARLEETRSLEKTFISGERYLRDGDDIFEKGDLEELEIFGMKLENFLAKTNSKWMGRKFSKLKSRHQEVLLNLLTELTELYDDVYDYIRELERDESLRREIDSLALPQTSATESDRINGAWLKKPFSHSQRLITAVDGLPTPS